jgi:hypothetical protein
MKNRRCILLVLLSAVAALAVTWFASPRVLVSGVRNEQVTWDGNIVGLCPQVHGVLPRLLLWRGRACEPFLRQALHDDRRYVAAHVYLSILQPEGASTSAESFNGLRVELEADGRTVIPSEQKQRLINRWNSNDRNG